MKNGDLLTTLQDKGESIIAGKTVAGVNSDFDNPTNKFNFVGQDHNRIVGEFMQSRNGQKLGRHNSIRALSEISRSYISRKQSSGQIARENSVSFDNLASQTLSLFDSTFIAVLLNADSLVVKFGKVFDQQKKKGQISLYIKSIIKATLGSANFLL